MNLGNLARAIELADARKRAALSIDEDSGVFYSDTEMQDRCVFSGFDIDYDELIDVATWAGAFFDSAGGPIAPAERRSLFTAAWVDGLLTGLLVGRGDHASHG